MMRFGRYLVTFGLSVLFLPGLISTASADIKITQKEHVDAFQILGQDRPATEHISVIWIGKKAARMDLADTASFLYFAGEKKLYKLQHESKTYSEIDIASDDSDQDKSKAAAAGEMKIMGGVFKIDLIVTPTGETRKIGQWGCEKYLVESSMEIGNSTGEAWATKDIDFDYNLFFSISRAFVASMPGYKENIQEMSKIDGLPVYSTTTAKMMGAEVKTTIEVTDIQKLDSPKGTFEVPADYIKVAP